MPSRKLDSASKRPPRGRERILVAVYLPRNGTRPHLQAFPEVAGPGFGHISPTRSPINSVRFGASNLREPSIAAARFPGLDRPNEDDGTIIAADARRRSTSSSLPASIRHTATDSPSFDCSNRNGPSHPAELATRPALTAWIPLTAAQRPCLEPRPPQQPLRRKRRSTRISVALAACGPPIGGRSPRGPAR
jgi:hypothetical protein